jgi:hypothetical protein
VDDREFRLSAAKLLVRQMSEAGRTTKKKPPSGEQPSPPFAA